MQIARENDLASMLAGRCLSIVSRRLRRCIYAFAGWPIRFAGLLGDEPLQLRTLAAFRADREANEFVKGSDYKDKYTAQLLKRSMFEHTAVKQYCEAFDDLGYDLANIAPIIDMARMKAKSVISEDCFNACKKSRLIKGETKTTGGPRKCTE